MSWPTIAETLAKRNKGAKAVGTLGSLAIPTSKKKIVAPLIEDVPTAGGDMNLDPPINPFLQVTNPYMVTDVVAEETISRSPLLSHTDEFGVSSQVVAKPAGNPSF